MRRTAGFTLIELALVIVIIGIGLAALTGTFSKSSTALFTNETLQQAAQYAQECAEGAITARRNNGFTWFASNTYSCSDPSGFTRTTNPVGSIYAGTSSGACNGHNPCPCPSGVSCRDVSVTVTSTTNSSLSSSITLMLVNY